MKECVGKVMHQNETLHGLRRISRPFLTTPQITTLHLPFQVFAWALPSPCSLTPLILHLITLPFLRLSGLSLNTASSRMPSLTPQPGWVRRFLWALIAPYYGVVFPDQAVSAVAGRITPLSDPIINPVRDC